MKLMFIGTIACFLSRVLLVASHEPLAVKQFEQRTRDIKMEKMLLTQFKCNHPSQIEQRDYGKVYHLASVDVSVPIDVWANVYRQMPKTFRVRALKIMQRDVANIVLSQQKQAF